MVGIWQQRYVFGIHLTGWEGASGIVLIGGTDPAAAATRHRHQSPSNKTRVRWEGGGVPLVAEGETLQ